MSTITVDENQLEEIVSKAVQQHLKLTFQDMDEVRKSPAGAIVRLETKIESLTDAVDELRAEIANSRAELKEESGKLRIEINNSRIELKEENKGLRAEMVNSRAEIKEENERLRAEMVNSRVEIKEENERLRAEMASSRVEIKEENERLRAEMANSRVEIKAEFEKIRAASEGKLEKLENAQTNFSARLVKVEGMLKLLVALYFALFGIVASWFAKSVFFP